MHPGSPRRSAERLSEEQNDILTKRLNILELANQRLTELNEERASENQDLSEQLRIYKKRVEALRDHISDCETEQESQSYQIRELQKSVEIHATLIEVANSENDRLNEEVKEQANQISEIERDKSALSKSHEQFREIHKKLNTTLKSRVPIAFSPEEIEKINVLLQDLKSHHENDSYGDLLTLALATAARNEKNTLMRYNLNDYKKKNPDFLTSKQFQS